MGTSAQACLSGCKAIPGAIAQLGLSDSEALPAVDEEIVAVVENDACGVDAVQVLLGCTYGKSNLIARIRGKMAFSFFRPRYGQKASAWFLNPSAEKDCRAKICAEYLFTHPLRRALRCKGAFLRVALKTARLFASQQCAKCGEKTAEFGLRVQNGQLVCRDCYDAYQREGF